MLITTIVLLLISAKLMSLSREQKVVPRFGARVLGRMIAPAEKFRYEIFQSVNYFWRRYFYLLDVERERDDYLNQVKSLQAQNSRLVEFEHENKRLRALLGFIDDNNIQHEVPATVIGRNPSNWTRSVTINKGSDDGLHPGLSVVDGHAIVGQIIAVSQHASTVLLLTDNASAVDALVQTSRAPGIVEGNLDDKLTLRYIRKDYQVNLGDRIISSGLDQVYPKGKLIGVVVRVSEDKIGMFKSVDVEPSVDFARLENVLVLVSGEREMPDLGKEIAK